MLGQLYHKGVLTLVEFGRRQLSSLGMDDVNLKSDRRTMALPHRRSPCVRDRNLWCGMTKVCRVLHGVELVVWRLLGSSPIDLGLVQPRVDPSFPQQIFVGPDLGDSSILENHNPVRVNDRGEPMPDDDHRPALCKLAQGVLDERFGLRVDVRCRLIENEDARILQEDACNRDPLPLAYGEGDSTLANLRVIPLRQAHDEIVGICGLRRSHDVLLGSVYVAVQDILSNRSGEEDRLLQDEADFLP